MPTTDGIIPDSHSVVKCRRCGAEISTPYCPYCGRKQTQERKRRRRTSGSGSISKLSGRRAKPYLARLNGVTIGTFATVREAERALSRLVDVDVTDKYNWTFAQVYEAWRPEHAATLENRAAMKGTHTTGMLNYATSYSHCAPLHDKAMRQIRKTDLQAILTGMSEKGLSHSTISKVRQLMSQLYQWAIAEHICMANLATSLNVAPPVKAETPVFTPEEIRAIAECGMPAAKIALILLSTGCRIGELFQARTEDCTEDYFISGSKTAAGTRRIIPVSPLGLNAYRSILHEAQEQNARLLIEGYEGNHDSSNWRKREYYPMLDALGISREKTPHKTRHTYATAAVASGVRPEDLTQILGHASYSTTIDIYTHQNADKLVSAASGIDL